MIVPTNVLIPPPNSFLMARRIPGAEIRMIDGAGISLNQPSRRDSVDSEGIPRMRGFSRIQIDHQRVGHRALDIILEKAENLQNKPCSPDG